MNDLGRQLVRQALQNERQQRKTQRKPRKTSKTLTEKQIDEVFNEKCRQTQTIRQDLISIYDKSSPRIRSMLNFEEIEKFLIEIERRKI